MPYKDPKLQAAAQKRYYEKNRDKLAKKKHGYHQENLEKRRDKIESYNRSQGFSKRPKGPKSRAELVVPMSRRWVLFKDEDQVTRVYFTSKKGFTTDDLLAIMTHLTAANLHQKAAEIRPSQVKVIHTHENIPDSSVKPAPASTPRRRTKRKAT